VGKYQKSVHWFHNLISNFIFKTGHSIQSVLIQIQRKSQINISIFAKINSQMVIINLVQLKI